MKNAFERVFSRGFRNALLIGSDSPDLPGLIIDEVPAFTLPSLSLKTRNS